MAKKQRMSDLHEAMLNKMRGFSTQNKFEVELGRPRGLPNELKENVKRVSFNNDRSDLKDEALADEIMTLTAQNVTLPAKSFKTFTTFQSIAPNERPYQINYAPLVITFLMDADGIVYDYLYRWFNTVYNIETNVFNFYDEYVADINVRVFDNHGYLLLEVKYIDAYPSIQNEMIFDSKIMNSAQTIPITFQYRKLSVENYGDGVYKYGF